MHLPPHDVSMEDLSLAIQERSGAPAALADDDAALVLRSFGGRPHVVDNDLDRPTRRVLYRLQAWGLARTRVQESVLPGGRPWRTYTWHLQGQRVRSAARGVSVAWAERAGGDGVTA